MQACFGRGLGGKGQDGPPHKALWLLPRCEQIPPTSQPTSVISKMHLLKTHFGGGMKV